MLYTINKVWHKLVFHEGNNHYYYDMYNFDLREPYSKMRGGGLDVNYKKFVNSRRTVYFSTGLSYTRLGEAVN